MRVIRLDGVRDGSYNLNGTIMFKTRGVDIQYAMTQKDALEIAYTLVDSLGLPYSILDQVEQAINGDQE